MNAALLPIVQRYLDRLAAALRERGIRAPLYVMQSNGGMALAIASRAARRDPRERSGKRRHRRSASGAGRGSRARTLLRYGRHDGKGRHHPGRRRTSCHGVRSRRRNAQRALRERQRLSGAVSVRRFGGDQRGRRDDRMDRRGGRASRRADLRRRRSRTRVLREQRTRHRNRCERRARALESNGAGGRHVSDRRAALARSDSSAGLCASRCR